MKGRTLARIFDGLSPVLPGSLVKKLLSREEAGSLGPEALRAGSIISDYLMVRRRLLARAIQAGADFRYFLNEARFRVVQDNWFPQRDRIRSLMSHGDHIAQQIDGENGTYLVQIRPREIRDDFESSSNTPGLTAFYFFPNIPGAPDHVDARFPNMMLLNETTLGAVQICVEYLLQKNGFLSQICFEEYLASNRVMNLSCEMIQAEGESEYLCLFHKLKLYMGVHNELEEKIGIFLKEREDGKIYLGLAEDSEIQWMPLPNKRIDLATLNKVLRETVRDAFQTGVYTLFEVDSSESY